MSKPLTARGVGAADFVKESRVAIYTVSSNEDSQFSEQLVKSGVEREDLTGLRGNRVRITKITMQSAQQLLYEILIYGTDAFEESDLGDEKFIASVLVDLVTYGTQQTSSQWKLDLEGLDIDYIDSDSSKEIHVVLRNLSPTTKNAGSTGAVKVDITCESRT